jgi:HTH-type transcriptional regulator, glycine betaine synthesis regulator
VPDRDQAAVLRIADAVGALMESWGFKRNMGRMWALLYLEGGSLSAGDIGERLELSSGAVSMLLTELQQWSVVKKTWVPGERRDFYEAETNIWKPVSRVFRERELRWIQTALEEFEAAQTQLGTPAAADARGTAVTTRINGLVELARVGATLLENVLAGASIDSLPIKTVGELAAQHAAAKKPDKK